MDMLKDMLQGDFSALNIQNNWKNVNAQWAFLGNSVVKNPPANAEDAGDGGFTPWVGKIPWRRK